MNTRIVKLRKSLKLTQQQFANQIGVSRSLLSQYELNCLTITERTIYVICAKFNVNEEWLRSGKGQMFNTVDKSFNDFFSIFNSLSKPLQDFLLETGKSLIDLQHKL